MFDNPVPQELIFLYYIIFGVVLDIIYSCIISVYHLLTSSKILLIIFETLYISLSSIPFFIICLETNYGVVRAYMILATIIGFLVCHVLAGKYIIRIFLFIVNTTVKFLRLFFNKISIPFVNIYYFIVKIAKKEEIKN